MRKHFLILLVTIFTMQLAFGQFDNRELNKVMPIPKDTKIGVGSFIIQENFTVAIQDTSNKRIYNATTRFIRRLSNETGVFLNHGFPLTITENKPSLHISYDRIGELKLFEDESYNLEVTNQSIKLHAVTDIGVLRGLETLYQLLNFETNHFYIPSIKIIDAPRFPWRGLMIDVARHFQPLDVLKRNLDAMSAVKLNVFHWHLTDDQGFRVESKTHPKLHELGSDGQYYTQQQIKEVISYAGDRGIRVIPEFDVPGHATAILTAYPEIASKNESYTIERNAGIFDPTLDPTNEKTYEVLSDLFEEMTQLFPDEYVHIGGDENEGKHWSENDDIKEFMNKKGFSSNHELQTHFNIRLQEILKKYGKKMIGWEEIMSPEIDKSAIIHSWKGVNEGLPAGESLIKATEMGYKTILSNGYYIDLMLPVEEHYEVDPVPYDNVLTKEQEDMILGGEATMWSELVTPLTIDSRIWPRTAAIAERFWSPKEVSDVENMKMRLHNVSLELEKLGTMHLRNREVILRNITKTEDITAISELTKVCEPLKLYSRNKGGTEYQTYSPFTLFADACTTDAKDAKEFENLVDELINQPENKKIRIRLNQYLHKWNLLSSSLEGFDNPIINEIKPISENLSQISNILSMSLKNNNLSTNQEETLKEYIERAKKPVADVELVVIVSFERLMIHLKNYSKVAHK
ncbi:beta-N-acetylhexosaminidase [Aquimarina sp. AD10]|uniref:beta-N-acetylhexosaminidase n=1 Tax=Aquimarina sp. AD10 TaxID=1714849 RepID=UPI000E4C13AA|nr:family 20 glycosylhydrolase [Aquimarina sp. AD10]AXT60225.1 beta-N-acetylhexosaminidase [Aquimarina sp. AD10]RKN01339.1 beta-N-acetylhexosaminidase [Aquimarina sp. AD10]